MGASDSRSGGMDGGGGGNEMKAQFITRGQALSQSDQISADDRKALTDGLHNLSGVTSTPILISESGQPVENQKMLVAWTNITQTANGPRAEIQLKETSKSKDEDSWEDHYRRGESLDDEIFHELMRASNRVNPATGKSVDENYEISRGKYHLDRLRTEALQEQGSTAMATRTDFGQQFCATLATDDQKKECQGLMYSEGQLISALLSREPTPFDVYSEWQTHSELLDGMLVKSDKHFADDFAKLENYKTQEMNACEDFKGVGFEEVDSSMRAILAQNSTGAPERAYFEYVKRFESSMAIAVRFVRSSNTQSH